MINRASELSRYLPKLAYTSRAKGQEGTCQWIVTLSQQCVPSAVNLDGGWGTNLLLSILGNFRGSGSRQPAAERSALCRAAGCSPSFLLALFPCCCGAPPGPPRSRAGPVSPYAFAHAAHAFHSGGFGVYFGLAVGNVDGISISLALFNFLPSLEQLEETLLCNAGKF